MLSDGFPIAKKVSVFLFLDLRTGICFLLFLFDFETGRPGLQEKPCLRKREAGLGGRKEERKVLGCVCVHMHVCGGLDAVINSFHKLVFASLGGGGWFFCFVF